MCEETSLGRAIEWWIWQLKGVGDVTMAGLDQAVDGEFARLADKTPDALDAFLADLSIKSSIREQLSPAQLRRAPDLFRRARADLPPRTRILHATDIDYPPRLHALEEPPRFLYVRGHAAPLHAESMLAIVGSRDARVEGIRQTRGIAEAVGRSGRVIISGGAIGVDAAAHRGAIEGDAQTVVVLPGAVDSPRPAKNARIFDAVLERGCLISEYPPGTGVRKYHFHRRNRLIAALGDWLLVARAGERSGTMITARAAAELGRPIMTMAGDMNDSRFAGCVKLMAAGASCVRSSDDVIRLLEAHGEGVRGRVDEELIQKEKRRRKAGQDESDAHTDTRTPQARIDATVRERLSDGACDVVDLFEDGGANGVLHLDSLRRDLGAGAAGLDAALLELELESIVEKVPGKNAYRLVK